jgi:general secretion pathway protein D
MKELNLVALILLMSFFTGMADEQIKLQFTNTDVREVIALYEKLTSKKMIYDNTLQGPVNLNVAEPVSEEKAIELIEKTLFSNGFALVDSASDTIQVVGLTKNARGEGIPTYSKPDEIPHGERVFSYIIKLQYREAIEIARLLDQHIAPSLYTSVVSDAKSNTVIVTERTSVVRGLLKAVAAFDVPPADKK